jgi:hypothetical protein
MQTYNGLVDDPETMDYLRLHADSGNQLRRRIAAQADDLIETFKRQRALLHEKALAAATLGPDGRPTVSTWCSSLTPEWRIRRGTLEIEWSRVTFGAFGPSSPSCIGRRKKSGDYSVTYLLHWAKPYEVDLVAETEREAAILRGRWRALAAIDRGAVDLQKTIRTSIA